VVIFSVIFSGCATVSAGKSDPEPVAAKISIVPSAIDFKAVVVGQKNSQTVKITNSTLQSISLTNLQVSGTGFSLSSVKAPVLLAAGSHIELSVVFAPPSAAGDTGALLISGPDLKAPVSVALSGEGKSGSALTSLKLINFGTRTIKPYFSIRNPHQHRNISLSIGSIVANPVFCFWHQQRRQSFTRPKLEFQDLFHPRQLVKTPTPSLSIHLPVLRSINSRFWLRLNSSI
jgi:hypothetical protein